MANKSRKDKLVIREGKRGFYWKRVAPNGEPIGHGGEPYTRLDGAKKGALRANQDLGPESFQVTSGGRKSVNKPAVAKNPSKARTLVSDVEVPEPVDPAVTPTVVNNYTSGASSSVDLLPVQVPKIPDTWSRTIRTFLWAVLALAPSIPTAVALFNLSAETAAKVGGVTTVLVTVVTFLVNTLEESGYLPPILKK